MARIYAVSGEVAPPVAQQIFTIGSAIAGGVAGFVLANSLSKAEVVPTDKVLGATLISALFTLGAALVLAKSVEEEPHVSRTWRS